MASDLRAGQAWPVESGHATMLANLRVDAAA